MGYYSLFRKLQIPLITFLEYDLFKFVKKRENICDSTKNKAKNLEFVLKISIDLVIIVNVKHKTQYFFFVEQITLRKIIRTYVLFFCGIL